MTRDRKTFAWLTALAVWLSVWWMLRSNPCLDNALGNQWSRWFATSAPARAADMPVVSNPYGIVACDYWPEARDHVITLVTMLLITGLIGHLAARSFERRPVRRAGAIMFAALTVAFGLSNAAFLPDLLRDREFLGMAPALFEVTASLACMLLGASLAALAAWLTVRRRARG